MKAQEKYNIHFKNMKIDQYLKHLPGCATTQDHHDECTCGLKEFEMYVYNLETLNENHQVHRHYSLMLIRCPETITDRQRIAHMELVDNTEWFQKKNIELAKVIGSHGGLKEGI